MDPAARALIAAHVAVSLMQVIICCRNIHHLLTRPDLKQPWNLLVQSPVHMGPINLVECIREHSGCPVEKGACNLSSRRVPDMGPCIRSHFPAIHKQAYWFKGERFLLWEIGDILGAEHRLCPGIARRIELCYSSQGLPLGAIVLVGLKVNIFQMK
jgi:hypothetical protein